MPNDLEEPATWLARADEVKAKGINGNGAGMPLAIAAKLWPTPLVGSGENSHGQISGNFRAHMDRAMSALWNTPRVGTHGQPGARATATGDALEPQAQRWATPSVADVTGGHKSRSGSRSGELLLNGQAEAWATPSARDWKSDDPSQSPEHSPPLGRQVLRTETAGSDGSPGGGRNPSSSADSEATTPRLSRVALCAELYREATGARDAERLRGLLRSLLQHFPRSVLAPPFVEALMGFPPSWTVPTGFEHSATPSSPRKRAPRSSSSRAASSPEEPRSLDADIRLSAVNPTAPKEASNVTEETKTEKKTTKTRGAKRDPAVIEKELEERLAKLREKKKLASTPGLKHLRAALDEIVAALKEAKTADAPHISSVDTVRAELEDLIEKLTK